MIFCRVTRVLICDVSKEHAAFVFKGGRCGTPQPLKMKEAYSIEILGICNLLVSNYAENLNYCLFQFPYIFNLLGKIIITVMQ
jgi:hypothetical protein